jgi:hypothetical protein
LRYDFRENAGSFARHLKFRVDDGTSEVQPKSTAAGDKLFHGMMDESHENI